MNIAHSPREICLLIIFLSVVSAFHWIFQIGIVLDWLNLCSFLVGAIIKQGNGKYSFWQCEMMCVLGIVIGVVLG